MIETITFKILLTWVNPETLLKDLQLLTNIIEKYRLRTKAANFPELT